MPKESLTKPCADNGLHSKSNMQIKTREQVSVFLFALLTIAFFSCSKPKAVIPEYVLTEKEMIPVLVDIHIAQAASTLFDSNDSLKHSMAEMLPYILTVHHIERATYDSSISFYTRHPELMQKM